MSNCWGGKKKKKKKASAVMKFSFASPTTAAHILNAIVAAFRAAVR